MIRQPISLRKAKRQLLSLFVASLESRLPCQENKTQPQRISTKVNQIQRICILSARPTNNGYLRCFSTVPPPPVPLDETPSSSRTILDNQEKCEAAQIHDDGRLKENGIVTSGSGDDKQDDDKHIPVMVKEVLSYLEPKDNQLLVDMTFGAGGHARQILKNSSGVRYIGVDRDPLAFGLAQEFASNYRKGQVTPLLSRFSELPVHLEQIGVEPGTVDCFLMDLGVSSMQFDSASRGFGLSRDGPLDMRMDGRRNFRHDKLHRHSHVATKTFQALRIFVNDELNEINNGLEVAHRYLKQNGRCAVISFHSLEDRIVKRHFHSIDMDSNSNTSIHDHLRNSRVSYDNEEIKDKFLSRDWRPLSRKVVEASVEEVTLNPRSRSAKLRAAVKMVHD